MHTSKNSLLVWVLIMVLAALACNYPVSEAETTATFTPQATHTPQPFILLSTASPTYTIPATATATVEAMYTLEPAEELYYFENFNRPLVPFWDRENECVRMKVENDSLVIHIDKDYCTYYPILGFVERGWGAINLQVKAPNRDVHTYIGLGCQVNNEEADYGYFFNIDHDLNYQVWKKDVDLKRIAKQDRLSDPRLDLTEWTSFHAYCHEDYVYFSVGGNTLFDGNLPIIDSSGGYFSLMVLNEAGYGSSDVFFDGLSVAKP